MDGAIELNGNNDNESSSEIPHSQHCTLRIEGMTCASCVSAIEKRAKKIDGLIDISVALMAAKADVEYNPSVVAPAKIAEEITDMGFDASVLEECHTKNGEVKVQVCVSIFYTSADWALLTLRFFFVPFRSLE